MRWCLTAMLMLMVIGCLAATQAAAERRVALVIGNARYAHAPALPNPHNDAEDMANALARVGFEVRVGYDLDQIRFARIIDEFARALDGADVGLFFYAGHGLQISEKNYLVSTEARLESTFLVPSETIELDAVIRLMESKTGTNLIFLDACRNNPLTDNLKRNLEAANRAVNVGRGLARIGPTSRDTLVAFSAAPGEVATDGRGRNSPFTASLLRHIGQPGLEVSVMLKEVAADVRQETDSAQRPQQLSDMSKTFYFVKAEPAVAMATPAADAPPAAPASPAPPADPVEVTFWQSAAAANECESIRAYLRRFPGGRFVDLGLIAERRLCKAEAVVAAASPQAPPVPRPAAPAPVPAEAAASGPAAAPAGGPAPPPAAAVAVPAPAGRPPSAAPAAADIGRQLQKELARVGCATSGMEDDGSWGVASRNALRSFNERTRSVATIDVPTPQALEAVQSHRDRVCPVACEPGTELRGTTCVATRKERSRRAARPPEREHPQRGQRSAEGRANAAPSKAESEKLDPLKGESWFYMGKQRCKTYMPMGETPRIICP